VSDPKNDKTIISSTAQVTRIGSEVAAAPVTAPPSIPDVVIESELGRGGMGVVYKGRQGYINRPVAVKLLLHAGGAEGNEYVKRFQREATLLAGLNHPHIVACYQAGVTTDNNCYLVMEYLDGPNLLQYVKANGPLSETQALVIVKAIASALEYAGSKGIIHRDVKSENILLAPSDSGGSFPFTAKLVDLGLARPVKASGDMSLTRQGMLLGTPATMAPEQFDDPDGVDHRADIYGLGCAFYQSVTGNPAYAGNSLAQIVADKVGGDIPDPRKTNKEISQTTSTIIAWMLARKREERPQTYGDLIARVERVLRGEREASTGSAKPLVFGLVAVAVVAVIAMVFFAGPSGPATKSPEAVVATAPTPPVETPVAQTPVAVSNKPVTFGVPTRLFGETIETSLEAWKTVPGWVHSDEGDWLVGNNSKNTGRISRPIPASPWRVLGTINVPGGGLEPFREAGLRIELVDASAIAVVIKNLGATRLLTVATVASDGTSSILENLNLAAKNENSFELTCQGGSLSIVVNEVVVNPIRIKSEPSDLALTVTKGTVLVSALTLATAR